MNLNGIQPDAIGDNAAVIEEIRRAIGAMDDGTPFLLIPVRIETRFVQREEPGGLQQWNAARLIALLTEILDALRAIAARDLRTELVGPVKAKDRIKALVERPIYAFVERQIAVCRDAVSEIANHTNDAIDGSAAEANAVERLEARLVAGFAAAERSIANVRSPFQRTRLHGELATVEKDVRAASTQLGQRVVPAMRMLHRLRPADRMARRRGGAPPVAVPRTRLAGFAEAFHSALGSVMAAAEALESSIGSRRPLREGAQSAREAMRQCELAISAVKQVAIVPAAWKRQLLEIIGRAEQAGGALARVLERAATGGGAVTAPYVALAGQLESATADLRAAAESVRIDDGSIEVPGPTHTVDELWVRIFPDDIAVDTLEDELTVGEQESGETYWRETLNAADNEALKRGAWRALCLKHGSRRAAWIARITEPRSTAPPRQAAAGARLLRALQALDRRIDEVAQSKPGERIPALIRAAENVVRSFRGIKVVPRAMVPLGKRQIEVIRAKLRGFDSRNTRENAARLPEAMLEDLFRVFDRWQAIESASLDGDRPVMVEPDFPDVALKDKTWSRAPASTVLPRRFVVVAVSADRVVHLVAGNEIPEDLKLGIDPSAEAERYGLDGNGDLVVGDAIRWMVDFGEAVIKGMAVQVPITEDEARVGFDRLYVLGVRDEPSDEGKRRLEALFDGHHYGQTGLALLPLGTPTNNTERGTSGYGSGDDPDVSFSIERGDMRFDSEAAIEDAADGLRLARALGIDPLYFGHVANAEGRDIAEALLVNRALWPATFGNYLEEFFGSLFPVEVRGWIAEFALRHVVARGMVPAFRVGNQPYGVLPTTAFSRYVPVTGEAQFEEAPKTTEESRALFNRLLGDVLLRMHDDWTALRIAQVKHAHSTGVTDFQQHFLDMLGLEATSATSEYRFSLNCAGRYRPDVADQLLLDFGVPGTTGPGASSSSEFGPIALLQRFREEFRSGLQLGAGAVVVDGQVSDAFIKAHKRLMHSRAYDVRHLREPKPLGGPAVGTDAPTWIPQLLAASPQALVAEARAGRDGRPLLYLLLRQAALIEFRGAVLGILARERMLTDTARRLAASSEVFLVSTLSADYAVTLWNYVFSPLSQLDGRFAVHFPQGRGELYTYLLAGAPERTMDAYLANRGDNALFHGFPRRARHAPFVDALGEHASAVRALADIPAQRLEPLLFEHLDMVSYRLDAWLTGLAQQRLSDMRAAKDAGVHVGAFGWLEDLRPDTEHPVAVDVPAALATDATPIHTDRENQGFIHAPSLNHAVTAAILRSGYLSESAQVDIENRMAVNLSSSRVRRALAITDSVRAGNDLGSVLGYQFERFLHESFANGGVTLDDLIAPMRRAFPSTIPVDPALSSPQTARHVLVDGLALIETVQSWLRAQTTVFPHGATLFDILYDEGRYSGYPYDIHAADGGAVLPDITTAAGRTRLDAVLRSIDRVANALDAVGDLVVSEGVYQIAQGNHARAAAVVASLGNGTAPPRPEIVDIPRTGTTLSHRLVLQLKPVGVEAMTLPLGWDELSTTPRADAEPSINYWLGGLLGTPNTIRARVVDSDAGAETEITAADLDLQPIDLLAILGRGFDEGITELIPHLVDVVRPADLDDEHPPSAIRVDLDRDPNWPDDVRSFREIASLLESAYEMLTRGRAATAHDWVLEETADDGGALTSGCDEAELESRVGTAIDALRELGKTLIEIISDGAQNDAVLLAGDPSSFLESYAGVYVERVDGRRAMKDLDAVWAIRDDLADVLSEAAGFGVPHVDPPVTYASRTSLLLELLEKVEVAYIEVATRVQRADATVATLPSAPGRADVLIAAAKAVFGESFVLLPQFMLRNAGLVANVIAADLAPDDDPSLDGWLHGVGAVRPNAARLSRVLLLADAFGAEAPEGVPVQLPYAEGDPWLGGGVAAASSLGDRLSIAVFAADLVDTAGGPNVGIVVDQWTEGIPSNAETTGIAMHYDQPDAMPPQSLLLVVPPVQRGTWQWDDLLVALHDTFEIAKNRAVELEHLQHDLYGQILPGIVGELVPEAFRSTSMEAEVQGSRVILDFGQNNPTAPA